MSSLSAGDLEQVFEGHKLRRAEDVDAAAQDLFDVLIDRDHPALRRFALALLFKPKCTVRGSRIVRGTAQLATPREQELYGAQAFVTLGYDEWADCTERQREAIIDHQLYHFAVSEDEELEMVGHDVEEFDAVLRKHGSWEEGLARFVETAQKILPGLAERPRVAPGEEAEPVEEGLTAGGTGPAPSMPRTTEITIPASAMSTIRRGAARLRGEKVEPVDDGLAEGELELTAEERETWRLDEIRATQEVADRYGVDLDELVTDDERKYALDFARSALKMAPKKGEGITSVTLSVPATGQVVELGESSRNNILAKIRVLEAGGPEADALVRQMRPRSTAAPTGVAEAACAAVHGALDAVAGPAVDEEQYATAVQYVSEQQLASVSMLQRRFKLDYGAAGRLIDEMERRGVIGPHDGARPREVFVSPVAGVEQEDIHAQATPA